LPESRLRFLSAIFNPFPQWDALCFFIPAAMIFQEGSVLFLRERKAFPEGIFLVLKKNGKI
jgi:hypothetical protein